jgi:hypothetical protein
MGLRIGRVYAHLRTHNGVEGQDGGGGAERMMLMRAVGTEMLIQDLLALVETVETN